MNAAHDILVARDVSKRFTRDRGQAVTALDAVSFEIPAGQLSGLVGPDGAGKTTLLRLAAGLLTADAGQISVLGLDAADHPQQIQSRIAYMPQRFGLYEDLSVQENLDLYADLHGVPASERRAAFAGLMEMTHLGRFTDRLAGRLSGGMKQKLGLACTLVRQPELLLLDEPTVGVDPVSRRELWEIILDLVRGGLTVLSSTSYLDEAERCDRVVVLDAGRVLATGSPRDLCARAAGRSFVATPVAGEKARVLQSRLLDDPAIIDAVPEGGEVRVVTRDPTEHAPVPGGAALRRVEPRFEDAFMLLLHQQRPAMKREAPERAPTGDPQALGNVDAAVRVRDLTRLFGSCVAVDHVSFDVRPGEIFGLLGPNGAGKTTTFRMLCGLLPASSGALTVAGVDVRHARASARQRLGYVAQAFSLYQQLTVRENLAFFAGAYGLRGRRQRQRIEWAMGEFDLLDVATLPAGQLPGGFRRRLAMAAALMHEPQILFLDEPTSGADPQARREFWRRITGLAGGGVTVIVTTHFMEEAEYCDRAVIMDAGRILAAGTPADIRRRAVTVPGRPATMEDAFIAIVQESRSDVADRAGGAA